MPSITVPAATSYIVGSTIEKIEHDYEHWDPIANSMRLAALPPDFGFTVATWTPSDPDIVWEVHWNTKAERDAMSGSPGLIRSRPATDREIEDGQRQHTAAGGSDTHAAADELYRLRMLVGRAAFVAEHLMQMVPAETWRDTGGDDGQGHYEGDYRAEQTAREIEEWKRAAR